MASWLKTKLYGIRTLFSDGVPLPERPAINFVGANILDVEGSNYTEITFNELGEVADATFLATPEKIAKRSITGSCNFAGSSNFEDVVITGLATCSGGVEANYVTVTNDINVNGVVYGVTGEFSSGLSASDVTSTTAVTQTLQIDSVANVHKMTLHFADIPNQATIQSVQGAELLLGSENQTTNSTPSKPVTITSGDTAGTNSNTGTMVVVSGQATTSGNSGDVYLASGSAVGISGSVNVFSSGTSGASHASGGLSAFTGGTSGSTSASGAVDIHSGGTSGNTSASGAIGIASGATIGVTAPSGAIVIKSGNTTTASTGSPSGAVTCQAGDTAGTACNAGTISILGGTATGAGAHGSDIVITAGTTTNTGRGGNVDITAGGEDISLGPTVGGNIGITRGAGPMTGNIYLHKASSFADSSHGKGTVFLANCVTGPAGAAPVGGIILYSSGGNLFVRHATGTKQLTP